MSTRQLVEVWRAGSMPSRAVTNDQLTEERFRYLQDRLTDLERILGVVHGAVEYPGPTLGIRVSELSSGADTAITATTMTDIGGCTVNVTPDTDGALLVRAIFHVKCTLFGGIAQVFSGGLKVNGTLQEQLAITSASALNDQRTVSQEYIVQVSAGTSYTLKLTGQTANIATTYDAIRVHTGFIYTTFPNLYEVPG